MFRLREFTKRTMRLSFFASKGLRVTIYERPGLFLSEKELQDLKQHLIEICQNATDNKVLNYGVFSDSQRMNECVITFIYDEINKKPVAFNMLSYMNLQLRGEDIDLLHLGLVMVNRDYRNLGLSTTLYGMTLILLFFRRRFRIMWISNVTQVPAIIGLVAEGMSDAFPNPLREKRTTYDHIHLVRQIMSRHRHVFGVGEDAFFDEEKFIIRNAYTGGSEALKKTWSEVAKHRNDQFNKFCSDHLDYEQGDDFIQLAKCDISCMQNYTRKFLPKNFISIVLSQAVGLMLNSIGMAFVDWFNTSKPYFELRPRN